MRIIDAHMHLGEDLMFLTDDTEEVLLSSMKKNGVDAQIVQPGMLPRDRRSAHERIFKYVKNNPNKAYGLACFNPYDDEETYYEQARWAVKEMGFKGLKLQPYAFCMSPLHPAADKLFRIALELEVVLMIHTGNGVPVALPSLCIPMAKKYPDLPIILAHAGGGMYGGEAKIAAELCPNIFLETSWTAVYDLKDLIKTIGPERIMFGSDLVDNIPVELAKYKSLELSRHEEEWCLGKTAERVFRL